MHPNPAFRQTGRQDNIAFARERGFGTLCINGDDGPMLSHIPFVLNEQATEIEAHLVRSNPILRALRDGALPAVIAVTGPDGYLSPDWYGHDDQVPTWNYVSVHVRGTLEACDASLLPGFLDRLSEHFETRLHPKTPWRRAKMTADAEERMRRMIVPIRMRVDSVEGTWKLSQNKPDDARTGAIDHLASSGIGQELEVLRALMRESMED